MAKGKAAPATKPLKPVSTTIVADEVLTDVLEKEKPRFVVDYDYYVQLLWEANPKLHQLLSESDSLEDARDSVFGYLERTERELFELDNELHILEKATVREAIRVFKSIIGPINEKRTSMSALDCLWRLARGKRSKLKRDVSVGFLIEFVNLFRAVAATSTASMRKSSAAFRSSCGLRAVQPR